MKRTAKSVQREKREAEKPVQVPRCKQCSQTFVACTCKHNTLRK